MLVHGRLKIEMPGEPLRLGEEAALPISSSGPPPSRVLVELNQAGPNGAAVPCGGGATPVEHRADGSTYVTITPQCIGKVEVRILASFTDGGLESTHATTEVIAAKSPTALKVAARSMFNSVVRMDLSEQSRQSNLWLTAIYPGVKEPLPIRAQDAHFKVTMTKGEPPIRFDPETGRIDALRIGQALIETGYSGLTRTTCVRVTEFAQGYNPDHCNVLQNGGDGVLPIADRADAPGVTIGSKLPYTATDGRRGRFLADERVDVVTPDHPLKMAENNAIALTLRGPAVARIECRTLNMGQCVAWTGQWSRDGLAVTQRSNGSATVNVFPMEFGHVDFTFFILFVDGGVALKKVSVEVEPGTVKPRALDEGCDRGPELPARLHIEGPSGLSYEASAPLYVFACYDGVVRPFISPANLISYTVRSEGPEPVVQMDPVKGTVTGLRPGQALVQEKFQGLTSTRCVVVVPWERRTDPDLSNCRALRAKYGPPLTPIVAHVTKPLAIEDAPPPAQEPRVTRFGGAGVLGTLGTPSPIPTVDAITADTLSPDARDWFAADNRLEIPLAGLTARLGETTKVPIRLHGPEPLAMGFYEKRMRNVPGRPIAQTFEEGSQPSMIFREPDGRLFINVTALEMGTAEFRVTVLFADGGVATKTIEIPVSAPTDRPAHLINVLDASASAFSSSPPVTVLHLLMTPPSNTRTMFPAVSFDENHLPIRLQPRDVTFSLKTAGDGPVVQLDPSTGILTAQRVGHALVTLRFAGVETATCVVVMDDATRGDPSNCDELRGK
jgi:hypothetical protein